MRAVSMLLALVATAVLTVAPFLLVRRMGPAAHSILPILLLGVSVAFVHGIGYVPRLMFFRAIATPFVAWSLILGSMLALIAL